MKKIGLGFINILFIFVLFGILIPNTFAQAAETYVIVRVTSIYNPVAPEPANGSFLPDTTVTFSNDGSPSVITLTEEVFAEDEIVSDLVSLTPGSFYTITIQPKAIIKIEDPILRDYQGHDFRLYANQSTAETFCWLNGGEYAGIYEQEPFRQCEVCSENCCSEWNCTCVDWEGEGDFDYRMDGGCWVWISGGNIYSECMSSWDWQDWIACRYEGGCSSPYYRLKSVNCKKTSSDLNFEFTYTE